MTEANLKMHFPQFVLKYALALGIIGQVTHSSADIFSEKDQMLKPSAFSTYSGYLKKKKIGEGTYANVHVGIALDKSKEVKVAIKSIKAGLFTNGIDMSAVREITYLKELRHPNLISMMDVVYSPGDDDTPTSLNMVLEFLDSDLEMLINNQNIVISIADIKSWMMMLLRGVNFIHLHNVLHRDLKPNNLLLSDTGVLKIADFGLARNFGEMVPMTPTVVTRWYRAPELLFGAQYYGASIDIWASGCIFAELMLRVPYFAADTDIDQLKTIFKARGTPTERDWPVNFLYKGMKSLPNFLQFDKFEATPSRTLFTAAGDDAISLLDSMLSMDPNKRPSAAHCLRHDYFKSIPRPTRPNKLPRIAPSDADDPGQNKRKFDDDGEFGSGVKRRLF